MSLCPSIARGDAVEPDVQDQAPPQERNTMWG